MDKQEEDRREQGERQSGGMRDEEKVYGGERVYMIE